MVLQGRLPQTIDPSFPIGKQCLLKPFPGSFPVFCVHFEGPQAYDSKQRGTIIRHLTEQRTRRMTWPIPWILLLLAAAGLCGETHAQMRSNRGSSVRVHRTASPTDGSSVQTAFPVPGFGFDYVHLAAVNPGAFNAPAVRSSHLAPSFPIFIPSFSPPAQIIIVQQPPIVIVQAPPAVNESPEWPPRSRSSQRDEAREPERAPDPPRELEEIVLVRRDGTLLFAVAFSSAGGQLTYITREGLRRSLSLADLDLESTRRWNEERGTTLRLPS